MKVLLVTALAFTACSKQFLGLEDTPERVAQKTRQQENPEYPCQSATKALVAQRAEARHDDEQLSGVWSCNLQSTGSSHVWQTTWKTTASHGKVVIETRVEGQPELYSGDADGDGMAVYFDDARHEPARFTLDTNLLTGERVRNDKDSWSCESVGKYTCTRHGI